MKKVTGKACKRSLFSVFRKYRVYLIGSIGVVTARRRELLEGERERGATGEGLNEGSRGQHLSGPGPGRESRDRSVLRLRHACRLLLAAEFPYYLFVLISDKFEVVKCLFQLLRKTFISADQ